MRQGGIASFELLRFIFQWTLSLLNGTPVPMEISAIFKKKDKAQKRKGKEKL